MIFWWFFLDRCNRLRLSYRDHILYLSLCIHQIKMLSCDQNIGTGCCKSNTCCYRRWLPTNMVGFFNFSLFVLFIKTKQTFWNKVGLSIPVNLNTSKSKEGRNQCLKLNYRIMILKRFLVNNEKYGTPSKYNKKSNIYLQKPISTLAFCWIF